MVKLRLIVMRLTESQFADDRDSLKLMSLLMTGASIGSDSEHLKDQGYGIGRDLGVERCCSVSGGEWRDGARWWSTLFTWALSYPCHGGCGGLIERPPDCLDACEVLYLSVTPMHALYCM